MPGGENGFRASLRRVPRTTTGKRNGMIEKESRRAKRYDVEVAAEVTISREVLQSQTKNLSESGVCLVTRRQLDEGSRIMLNLFLVIEGIEDATSPSIDLMAEVIWAAPSSEKEFLAGCHFSDMSPKQVETLKSFLRQLEK